MSIIVSSGVTSTGLTLSRTGMFVQDGGVADSTTLNFQGDLRVSRGGIAKNTIVSSSGELDVYDGGFATNTDIKNGGIFYVLSGATASDITVNKEAYLAISGCGSALEIKENGGVVSCYNEAEVSFVSNSFSGLTYSRNWGTLHSGTTANSTTLDFNGNLQVYNGGVANDTLIKSAGYVNVYNGGTANDTVIQGGGVLYVLSDGIASNVNVNQCAGLSIYSCGSALEIKENGGVVSYYDGAEVSFVSNSFSGLTYSRTSGTLHSGTTANSTTLDFNGNLQVYNGGVANDTQIKSGGYMNVYDGGNANNVDIKGGGKLYIGYGYTGGVASNIIVRSNADLIVSSNGTALAVKENGGVVSYSAEANVVFVSNSFSGLTYSRNYGTLHSGTTANSTTLDFNGSLQVYNGGVANDTQIKSGGYMNVYYGASANTVNIKGGGKLSIFTRGVASNIIVSSNADLIVSSNGTALAVKENGGVVSWYNGAHVTFVSNSFSGLTYSRNWGTVHSGTTANSTTLNFNGSLYVYSGGLANGVLINSAGGLHVSQGGIVCNADVRKGGMLNLYGTYAGKMTIASGGTVSAFTGSVIDFTVAGQSVPETALVNNWSWISGRNLASYTLTVNSNQSAGTYVLAGGAADFNSVITVKTVDNAELGTLAVNETKTFGTSSYTLAKNEGTLELTITSAVSSIAKGDVDGNGISDVMFQYIIDRQIGFWLNGSSTWQGTGVSQPSDWILLGNYDMDASSKADQVMFGNVLGGAYIGYYKDGDTTGNGWVTIGYLNNSENIQWNNVVGNLTGNAGRNSIVWHAPELGACGVWTDGTANWVGISGGFDSSWEIQGCGDFTGDGKDEILWKCSGNLYTTDINSNFASLGGASGWEVCAIGDFSGDGTDDIVLFHEDTGSVMKYENGQASQWVSLGQLDAADWFVVGAGDYNNDQQDDLLVRQLSTGMLGYYANGDMSKWVEMGRGVDMYWTVIA